MATCMGMNCGHLDEKSGKCVYGGVCIVKQYNLNDMASLNSVLKTKLVVETPVVEPEQAEEKSVFNPFQRGNGCMLAGYSHDEIWAHVR
ncbi:MAG: hypothetical protein J6Q44_01305 [Alphaproteobacteria bacterium]|nr:hypothetical protein [Alphaproteobacteria bacterium]